MSEQQVTNNPKHLSNVQMEILKLYSTDIPHDELLELKKVIAEFFAKRAITGADKIWEEKKLSNKTMDEWLISEQ
jgi:hypothetical protein